MYRTRENFGILVKQREKIKRSFWNFLYLEKYYTTKSSNFLACLPNQNQKDMFSWDLPMCQHILPPDWSSQGASWLVELWRSISQPKDLEIKIRQKEWTTRDPPYWLTHTASWLVKLLHPISQLTDLKIKIWQENLISVEPPHWSMPTDSWAREPSDWLNWEKLRKAVHLELPSL